MLISLFYAFVNSCSSPWQKWWPFLLGGGGGGGGSSAQNGTERPLKILATPLQLNILKIKSHKVSIYFMALLTVSEIHFLLKINLNESILIKTCIIMQYAVISQFYSTAVSQGGKLKLFNSLQNHSFFFFSFQTQPDITSGLGVWTLKII